MLAWLDDGDCVVFVVCGEFDLVLLWFDPLLSAEAGILVVWLTDRVVPSVISLSCDVVTDGEACSDDVGCAAVDPFSCWPPD